MSIRHKSISHSPKSQTGVSLIETIVFVVVVSIALVALVRVFSASVSESVDPVVRIRALELGQAQLDEVLARKFDENTPTGGVPPCDSATGVACAGIVADGDYDDVGDFNAYVNNAYDGYSISVSVTSAGADIGLPDTQARLINVSVSMPTGDTLSLSSYKVNF